MPPTTPQTDRLTAALQALHDEAATPHPVGFRHGVAMLPEGTAAETLVTDFDEWAAHEATFVIGDVLSDSTNARRDELICSIAIALKEAVMHERKACAALMDSLCDQAATDLQAVRACAFGHAAAAIRSRSGDSTHA